jgi:hypothetical protein
MMIDGSQHRFAPTPHTPHAFPKTPWISRRSAKFIADGKPPPSGGQFTQPGTLLIVFATPIAPNSFAALP